MSVLIHPLLPHHYAAAEALILAAAPERHECAKEWSQRESQPDANGFIRQYFVAVEEADPDAVLGYASLWPQRAGRFRMDLIVAPAHRKQGIGSALLDRLLQELPAQNAVIMQARTRNDRLEALAFLMHHGFIETNRMVHLRLQVAHASLDDLPLLTERLAEEGVTITTLAQEQARIADSAARGQTLVQAANPERADPYCTGGEIEFASAEDARKVWEGYLPLAPDAFFLARHGEEYVGLSYLVYVDETNAAAQGDTAVHVGWRRKGIGALLKLHTIAYAQQHGYAAIKTCTASPGMLALNKRVGFQEEWSEIRLVREV
jgi:GNAT superfamily N-acetyltransferase